jgi:hypothetical protein
VSIGTKVVDSEASKAGLESMLGIFFEVTSTLVASPDFAGTPGGLDSDDWDSDD